MKKTTKLTKEVFEEMGFKLDYYEFGEDWVIKKNGIEFRIDARDAHEDRYTFYFEEDLIVLKSKEHLENIINAICDC